MTHQAEVNSANSTKHTKMSFLPRHPAASANTIYPSKTQPSPVKKQKMSITQTYYLAHQARGKLSHEAAQPDHNLRLLVGHANLLDSLMVELADAEQDQERWFNQTVSGAAKASEDSKRHIQWADSIPEESEDSSMDDAEDSDSDDEEEEVDYAAAIPLRRMPSPPAPVTVSSTEVDEDDEDYEDDQEDYSDLALVRTSSHQPPELLHDSDEESEDDSMPPSPPEPTFPLTQKERHAIATTSFYDAEKSQAETTTTSISSEERDSLFDESYYLPQRAAPTMITAY